MAMDSRLYLQLLLLLLFGSSVILGTKNTPKNAL